ncbi:hypothetical protein HHU13_09945 [Nocardia globerula]|nr:hypothetical protein [Nocardia globerula]
MKLGTNTYDQFNSNVLLRPVEYAQVAVVGVEDPVWGEAVKAVVVAAADHELDATAILAFTRARLAGYKCPKSIDVVAELPLGATGKILKRELRAQYAAL